jgi:hypothetical protein
LCLSNPIPSNRPAGDPLELPGNRAKLDCCHVDLYFVPPPSFPHRSSLSEESTNLILFSGQDCLCLFQHNINAIMACKPSMRKTLGCNIFLLTA